MIYLIAVLIVLEIDLCRLQNFKHATHNDSRKSFKGPIFSLNKTKPVKIEQNYAAVVRKALNSFIEKNKLGKNDR